MHEVTLRVQMGGPWLGEVVGEEGEVRRDDFGEEGVHPVCADEGVWRGEGGGDVAKPET